MKMKFILAALALSATAAGVAAQSSSNWQSGNNYSRDAYARGAPDSVQQRIESLERRIDRGTSDGSLDRTEARRAHYELDTLRRDADALDARLDSLSRNLRWSRRDGRDDRYGSDYRDESRYGSGYGDSDRDPYATDYDASHYYRDDARYQERRLGSTDEVYRGSDGRYYCKRSDGTTGLIIGAAGGALLGNVFDGGRHRTGGTLVGGALGALLGRSVEQNSNQVRCR